jgi:hypothetical protein
MMMNGKFVNCLTEFSVRLLRSLSCNPSSLRSLSHSSAIAFANLFLISMLFMMMKRHGWALCAEGTHMAASKTFIITFSDGILSEYTRTLRRALITFMMLDDIYANPIYSKEQLFVDN